MSTSSAKKATGPTCDACDAAATLVCDCRRCASEPEPDERFWACKAHKKDVESKHYRIRGRQATWAATGATP